MTGTPGSCCLGGCPVVSWSPAPLHKDQGLPSRDGISALCLQLTPDLSPDVGGPADPIAPTIIIPPKNTSVVAGTSEVTLECVANARWVVCPPLPAPLHPELQPTLLTWGLQRDQPEFREVCTCHAGTQERRWGVDPGGWGDAWTG